VAGFHEETPAAADSLPALGKAGSINNGKLDQSQGSTGTSPPCPQCGSAKVWKDGIRETAFGPVQRYLCRRCAYRFSDPNSKQLQRFFNGSGTSEHVETIHTKKLKSKTAILAYCRVSNELYERASTGQPRLVKSLAEVETRQENAQREGTTQTAEIKGKIVEFLWHLKKQGRSDNTIANYKRRVLLMIRAGVDLFNAEAVKEYLAKRLYSNGTKVNDVCAYGSFLKFLKIPWEPPIYRHEGKIPFIPTEAEIDQLIAASGRKVSVVLQLLKETGMRIGEAMKLKWTDIDFERRTVRISPEKHSNPRIIPVSNRLLEMLSNLPKHSEKIFPMTRKAMDTNFYKQRKKIARKLGNPRLLQISFHTLRHWKGTMEYHKTKDPEYVKRLLGHRRMDSTMLYINIEQAVFQNTPPDEFHVKVAQTTEEIKTLLEAGFEYILQKDSLAFFRKRK